MNSVTSEYVRRGLTAAISGVMLILTVVFALLTCCQLDLIDFMVIMGFSPLFVIPWCALVYESLGWDPPVPYSWYIAVGFISLGEVVLLPPLVYSFLRRPMGLSVLVPPLFTHLAPLILYLFESEDEGSFDDRILAIARKYGGILTLGIVVSELKVSLEKARKHLERFVKYGEAVKKRSDTLTIYDFPSARVYLSQTDKVVIELLRDNPYGLSKTELLRRTGLSIESLDETLKRLESKGIVYQDMVSDTYKLAGIAPRTD